MDHWLIGDYEVVGKYSDIKYFDKLNALEKLLLVYSIAKHDQKEAKALVERIRIDVELIRSRLKTRTGFLILL